MFKLWSSHSHLTTKVKQSLFIEFFWDWWFESFVFFGQLDCFKQVDIFSILRHKNPANSEQHKVTHKWFSTILGTTFSVIKASFWDLNPFQHGVQHGGKNAFRHLISLITQKPTYWQMVWWSVDLGLSITVTLKTRNDTVVEVSLGFISSFGEFYFSYL